MADYKAHLSEIDVILYVDNDSKYYCLNPAASETEDIMHGLGYTDYKASEMNTTKFMGGITLNFMLITEKELSGLVISDGESGRKGFAKHLYKNPSRVFLTKMQIGNNE